MLNKFRFFSSRRSLIFVCTAFLLPYLFLGYFNFPSADDFTYAIPVIHKGFIQAQIDWYNEWSGRFVSTAILSISPIVFKSYIGYKFIGVTTFFILIYSLWYFLASVLGHLFEKKTFVVFFILFVTVFLGEIPSITEAIHWFPGVVNYTYAFIVFLFGLGFYLRSRKINLGAHEVNVDLSKEKWSIAMVLSVVSFLLAGFNETLVVIWLYLIFVTELFFITKLKKIDYALIVPFLIGLISFYVVFKAPGNAIRAAQFSHNHDLLFTLFRPLGLFVEIFFRYLKVPFLIFLLFVIPEVEALRVKIPAAFYSKRLRWFTFGFFLSLVFLFLAPAHWAIGGAPPRRAMNILCFFYVLFTLIMYCQWTWAKSGKFLACYQRLPKWFDRGTQAWILVFSFFMTSNHGVAWADLLFRARGYASQQQERIDTLERANNSSELVFEPLRQRPETLFFSELEKDPTDWINQSVSGFYGVKSVRVK